MYLIEFDVRDKPLSALGKNLDDLNIKVNTLNKNLSSLNTTQLNSLSSEIAKVAKNSEKAAASTQKLSAATQAAEKNVRGITAAQKEHNKTTTLSQQLTAAYRASLSAAGISMGMFGAKTAGAATVAYVLTSGLREVISAGREFTSETSRATAIMSMSRQEMDSSSQALLDLSESTRYTASQVATGYTALGMSGFNAKESLDALEPSLNLASIGQLGLYQSADILTNVMNGYALSAEYASSVSDDLATAVTSSNATVQQMGNALSYVAPVAYAAGAGVGETVAQLQVLHNAGIKGSRAGTTLRRSYANLINPSAAASRVLRELGIAVNDSTGEMRPMIDILDDFAEKGADTKDILEVFGVWAFPGVTKLIEDLKTVNPELEQFEKNLANNSEAAKKMAKVIEDNLSGDILKFYSALERKYISVFQRIEPTLRSAVQGATNILKELDTEKVIKTTLVPVQLQPLKTGLLALNAYGNQKDISRGKQPEEKTEKPWRFPGNITQASEADREKLVSAIAEMPVGDPALEKSMKILQDYDRYIATGLTPEIIRSSERFSAAMQQINRSTLSEEIKNGFEALNQSLKTIDFETLLGGKTLETSFKAKSAAITATGNDLIAGIKNEIEKLSVEYAKAEPYSEGQLEIYKRLRKANQDLADAQNKLTEAQEANTRTFLKLPDTTKLLETSRNRISTLKTELGLLQQQGFAYKTTQANELAYTAQQVESRAVLARKLSVDESYIVTLNRIAQALKSAAKETQIYSTLVDISSAVTRDIRNLDQKIASIQIETEALKNNNGIQRDSQAARALATAAMYEQRIAALALAEADEAEINRLRDLIGELQKKAKVLSEVRKVSEVRQSFQRGEGLTPEDRAQQEYERDRNLYKSYLDLKLIDQAQYNEALIQLETQRFDRQNALVATARDNVVNSLADTAAAYVTQQQTGEQAMKNIGKAIIGEVVRALTVKLATMASNAVMSKLFAAQEIATEQAVTTHKVASEATKASAAVAGNTASTVSFGAIIAGSLGHASAMNAAWWPVATAVSLATAGANAPSAVAGILSASLAAGTAAIGVGVAAGIGGGVGGIVGGNVAKSSSPSWSPSRVLPSQTLVPSGMTLRPPPVQQAVQTESAAQPVTSTHFEITINAVDAKSVAELLTENSDLLYNLHSKSRRKFVGS